MERSEFGKGLVICLVKFAEHRDRWSSDKRFNENLQKEHPDLFGISRAVEMHFNAASDHLYDIEVPPEWQKTKLGKKVKELQDFGLEMGHGFTRKEWTEDDVTKAYSMCQDIALLIDKKLGLKPDIGQW